MVCYQRRASVVVNGSDDPINFADPQGLDGQFYALETPDNHVQAGFDIFDAIREYLGGEDLGLGSKGLWFDPWTSQWGFNIPSPLGIHISGKLYGHSYNQNFADWNAYAEWATALAATPESQAYMDFSQICQNHCDPNSVMKVQCTYGALVYSCSIPSLADQSVDRAALGGGWPDPINWFHKADSWYFGLFFDAVHLVDAAVVNGQVIPINAHVDPFGPANPFHYLIQLPAMLFGSANLPSMTCSINGGCQ